MKRILDIVRPSPTEEKELQYVSQEILEKTLEKASEVDERIRVRLVGSSSRGTWLRREKDLDIFLFFPAGYAKKEMEKIITNIAGSILKKAEKRYAEHPYIRGTYAGYDVELVPCYAVESASKILSAVDRTPFHEEFVGKHIKGKEDEVRLLKQFLKGIGCYGAEAKVEGVSGYLSELLVIKFGSFEDVLKAVQSWQPGEVLQISTRQRAEKLREKFPSPLIFIDPVDSNRNVASALSEEKFGRFGYAAKEYLKAPRKEFFFPRERKIRIGDIKKRFRERGTDLVALFFLKPDVVEDIFHPQMKKALGALERLLRRSDFRVVGASFFIRETACLLLELEDLEIPPVKLHLGPGVNSEHEKRFLEKHEANKARLTEPFILGGRWGVFLRRGYVHALKFLEVFLGQPDLEEKGIPSYVASALQSGVEVKLNEEAFTEEFLPDLLEYFDPRFPWEIR